MPRKAVEPKVVDKRPNYDLAPAPKPVAPAVKAVPLGSKVLVWRVPEDEGLIAIADSAKEKPLECEVVAVSAVGLNEYDTQLLAALHKGDKILIRKHTGSEIKVEGHELTVLHVQDVLLRL
jgi:chaperonin GroES